GSIAAAQAEFVGERAMSAPFGRLDGNDIGLAVGGMDEVEPALRSAIHDRAGNEAERVLEFFAYMQRLIIDAPVPHILLGACKSQSTPAGFLEQALNEEALAESKLGKRKSHGQQDDDQTGEKHR